MSPEVKSRSSAFTQTVCLSQGLDVSCLSQGLDVSRSRADGGRVRQAGQPALADDSGARDVHPGRCLWRGDRRGPVARILSGPLRRAAQPLPSQSSATCSVSQPAWRSRCRIIRGSLAVVSATISVTACRVRPQAGRGQHGRHAIWTASGGAFDLGRQTPARTELSRPAQLAQSRSAPVSLCAQRT